MKQMTIKTANSKIFSEVTSLSRPLDDVIPNIKYAKIKPTRDCNSRCITCDFWQTKHEGELDTNHLYEAIKQLRQIGVDNLMITGGEPTISKDLDFMITTAKKMGFTTIGMTTNSLSLSEKKIDTLLKAGLNEIVLSLEGLNLHDEIRGIPGNTQKVIRNLTYLSKQKLNGNAPDLSLNIGTTIMSKNLDEILGLVKLAQNHDAAIFFNLIDRGTYFFKNAATDLFEINDWPKFNNLIDQLIHIKKQDPKTIGNSIVSLEYARTYFKDPKQKEIPCYLGYVGIEIDSNGDIFSNCWGLPPVGNIKKTSLKRIIQSRLYKKRCQDMYQKKCPGCSCGYILNLAYHPNQSGESNRMSTSYTGERS